MKNWLMMRDKRRLSAKLDENGGAPPPVRARSQVDAFERDIRALDQALRRANPSTAAPPGLHQSIMSAIHEGQRSKTRRPRLLALRWAAACVLGFLAAGGWFLLRDRTDSSASTRDQPLAAVTQMLDLGSEMENEMPVVALAPLSGEWENVNLDVSNAARFLLASLP